MWSTEQCYEEVDVYFMTSDKALNYLILYVHVFIYSMTCAYQARKNLNKTLNHLTLYVFVYLLSKKKIIFFPNSLLLHNGLTREEKQSFF